MSKNLEIVREQLAQIASRITSLKQGRKAKVKAASVLDRNLQTMDAEGKLINVLQTCTETTEHNGDVYRWLDPLRLYATLHGSDEVYRAMYLNSTRPNAAIFSGAVMSFLRRSAPIVMREAAKLANVELTIDGDDRDTQQACLEVWSSIDGFGDRVMGLRSGGGRATVAPDSDTVSRIARWLQE